MAEMEITAPQIQTLAFLDLETTGLIYGDKPSPRITEIAVVAIHRDEFLRSIRQDRNENQNGQGSSQQTPTQQFPGQFVVPRVLSKLLQAFNPEAEIHHVASKISGLWPYNLSAYRSFPAFVPTLTAYLENLPKPICLIAHNGLRFDFPILKSELKRADRSNLGTDLVCADTMILLKNIDDRWMKENAEEKLSQIQESAQVEMMEQASIQHSISETQAESMNETIYRFRFESIKGTPGTEYETSPTKSSNASENGESSSTPSTKNDISGTEAETKTRRRLFPEPQSAKSKFLTQRESQSQSLTQGQSSQSRMSYSLKEIHKRVFDGLDPPLHHSAEGDCLSLLQIAAYYGFDFLAEIDKSGKPLSEIPIAGNGN